MDIETRFNGADGFVELQFGWNLMLSYDLRGWRVGFSFRREEYLETYSLNLLCFDIHLHR